MRKTLRFAALVLVLALTAWTSNHSAVQAAGLPSCTLFNGQSCDPSVPGRAKCYWYSAAEPGFCTCGGTPPVWSCCCIG
jgi:hypothetical protein